ncbi:MAG: hypothetical protein JNK37_09155 [Verrucomicrobiales bacterium]|nr:hypothetical protein [Verrucomicrobiales bacterium]
MKTSIVADGEEILRASPEYQAKLRALRESIEARFAPALSSAGFVRRCILRWQLEMDFRRECRQMGPSSQSLYSSDLTAESAREHHAIGASCPASPKGEAS